MPRRKEPKIPDAILDRLLAGADPKAAFDPNGLLDELKKALAERALNAERTTTSPATAASATAATATARRRPSPTPARSSCRCLATGRRASTRS